MAYRKAHLNLIMFLLNNCYKVAVRSEGDTLLKASSNYKAIKDHAECVDECYLVAFNRDGDHCGAAFLVFGNGDDEIVCDHTDNKLFNQWWDQYDA